jgi:hypothetical protein
MLVYWLLFYLTKLEIYSTKSRLRVEDSEVNLQQLT